MLHVQSTLSWLHLSLDIATTTPLRSAQSRTTTIYAFQTLSYVSEGIIFVYCGMDALDPKKWQVSKMSAMVKFRQANSASGRRQAAVLAG